MKNIFTFIVMVFLLSCANETLSNDKIDDKPSNYFKITAKINGIENHKIYLFDILKQQPVKVDSCISKNDKYSFKLKTEKSRLLGLGENINTSIIVIAKPNSSIEITADSKKPLEVSVTGDSDNKLLQSYLQYRNTTLINFQKLVQLPRSNENNKKIETVQKNYEKYFHELILNNPNSQAIVMTLFEISNPINQKEELLIIKNIIENNFDNPLLLSEVNKKIQQGNQQNIISNQQQQQIQQQEKLKKLGIEIGQPAPDLNFKDINNQDLKLSSLKGKIVLLDFWASWCRPCRAENPHVVELYKKYKSKGFTVYSVSLDQKREQWINAISKDELIWPNHVSDLQGWRSAAGAIYGINSIPKTFLIDRNGNIAATNLRGANLEKKLKELL
jgi:thiol-disulfide isomerase/thioredoxin